MADRPSILLIADKTNFICLTIKPDGSKHSPRQIVALGLHDEGFLQATRQKDFDVHGSADIKKEGREGKLRLIKVNCDFRDRHPRLKPRKQSSRANR